MKNLNKHCGVVKKIILSLMFGAGCVILILSLLIPNIFIMCVVGAFGVALFTSGLFGLVNTLSYQNVERQQKILREKFNVNELKDVRHRKTYVIPQIPMEAYKWNAKVTEDGKIVCTISLEFKKEISTTTEFEEYFQIVDEEGSSEE